MFLKVLNKTLISDLKIRFSSKIRSINYLKFVSLEFDKRVFLFSPSGFCAQRLTCIALILGYKFNFFLMIKVIYHKYINHYADRF